MTTAVEAAVGTPEGSSDEVAPKKGNNKYGRKGRPLSRKRVSDLEAMRYVVSTSWSEEKTYQHKEMRKWLESDRKGFMVQLQKLEAEERANQREKQGGGEEATGKGSAEPLTPDLTVGELQKLGLRLLGEVDVEFAAVIGGSLARAGSAGVEKEPGIPDIDIGGGGSGRGVQAGTSAVV